MTNDSSPIILAFSGGLDTSFCVPWLKEHYGRDVVTATVNTGGIDAEAARALAPESAHGYLEAEAVRPCRRDPWPIAAPPSCCASPWRVLAPPDPCGSGGR